MTMFDALDKLPGQNPSIKFERIDRMNAYKVTMRTDETATGREMLTADVMVTREIVHDAMYRVESELLLQLCEEMRKEYAARYRAIGIAGERIEAGQFVCLDSKTGLIRRSI